jgi:hypothetical protein
LRNFEDSGRQADKHSKSTKTTRRGSEKYSRATALDYEVLRGLPEIDLQVPGRKEKSNSY